MPDIAIGAIVAAVIGAMISLAGLVISKEAKVSEFRQAWIDSLRKELALFVTNINALADARSLTFKDDMDRFEKLSGPTSRLNEAYYLVALRLNVSETSASAVRQSMVKLAGITDATAIFNSRDFDNERVTFINSSNTLLKDEWKRVKAGEKVYRWTRFFAAGIIGTLMIAMAIILATNHVSVKPSDPRPRSAIVMRDAGHSTRHSAHSAKVSSPATLEKKPSLISTPAP